MEKTKITTLRIVAVLTVLSVGLVLASIAFGESAHAQANTSSSAKNMTSATGGNKSTNSTTNSTNPLANVPIIGKLFGGK